MTTGSSLLSCGLLAVVLAANASATAAAAAAAEAPVATPSLPRSFLALGDSYTIGQGVAAEDRWPERLMALLGARGVVLSPPRVIARTGWTTADLARALAAERPTGPFDLVSLMVGVNDQFRGEELGEYGRRFAALLAEAVALAGGEPRRVLVLSIPDYGVTPFARGLGLDARAVAVEVDRFNDAARAAARKTGARWVDVTPASRRAAADAELIARDGLHPSAKLHAEWAALVLPAALAALSGEPPAP